MTDKPYHLNITERGYVITGEAWKSYGKSKIKGLVQERLDRIDDRILALERDITDTYNFTDFKMESQFSPSELGSKFGRTAGSLIFSNEHDEIVEPVSDFLSHAVVEMSRLGSHNVTSQKSVSQIVGEIIERTEEKSDRRLQRLCDDEAKVSVDNFALKVKKKEEEIGFIRDVLIQNDTLANDWVINKVQKILIREFDPEDIPEKPQYDDWNPFEAITEADILEAVKNNHIEEWIQLREQVNFDIGRLLTKRRGVYPCKVFAFVALDDMEADDITRKNGMNDVITTILNDLSGKEREREIPTQIWSERPLIQKIDSGSGWALTEYGEFMSKVLFDRQPDLIDDKYQQELSDIELPS